MRAFFRAVIAVLALTAASHAQHTSQIAARVELHSFPTLTISDQQFLTSDGNGKQVTVTGEFRIVQGSGRLPVVVFIHGSGGMGANIEFWWHEFNAMGISAFAIDGFTGRGLTSVNTDQALLGRLNFILDAYRALDVLATYPRVDAARIALTIREEPKGILINAASKEPFTYKDPCVERDPHVNHDVAATQATRVAVKELLKTVFKLA